MHIYITVIQVKSESLNKNCCIRDAQIHLSGIDFAAIIFSLKWYQLNSEVLNKTEFRYPLIHLE